VNEAGLVDSVRAFWEIPADLYDSLALSTWEQD